MPSQVNLSFSQQKIKLQRHSSIRKAQQIYVLYHENSFQYRKNLLINRMIRIIEMSKSKSKEAANSK